MELWECDGQATRRIVSTLGTDLAYTLHAKISVAKGIPKERRKKATLTYEHLASLDNTSTARLRDS
eukprot:6201082-Pleurochrysis_carterae.AAC.2